MKSCVTATVSGVGAVYLVMVRVGCVPLGGWHSTGAGVQWPGGGGGDHTCTLHHHTWPATNSWTKGHVNNLQ